MSNKPIVLITGVSGLVGSHVAIELLKQGYVVRGTVRSARQESLQSTICTKEPNLTLVPLEDVATGNLTDALKGVHSVIHIASPLAGKASAEVTLQSALDGTLNVLRQAVAAGVNKVVLTSSWAATLDPSLKQTYQGVEFTASDWGHATREEVLSGQNNPLWVYLATKILAEKAAWEFAAEHPELDLTAINPPFIYGPNAAGFPLPGATALGTNRLVYALISGDAGRALPPQLPPLFCDVRDVARAHVAALKVGSSILGKNKRYLVSAGAFTWKDAVEYITKEFPELKSRLPSTENAPALPGTLSTIDSKPASEELGLKEYIGWEQTVRDTVNALLKAEESWKSI